MAGTRKIEKLLRSAPSMPLPNGLDEKLKANLRLRFEEKQPVIHCWLAGSRRWIACAVVALICLIFIGYGTAKIIKKFVLQRYMATYVDKTKPVYDETKKVITSTLTSTTHQTETSISGDNINSKEDAEKAEKEMIQFIKEGKAKQVGSGAYSAVLPNWGEVVYKTGGLPVSVLEAENREEKIKEMYDEIERLHKAGKFKRILRKEVEKENGQKVRHYIERFTLSNGETIIIYCSYAGSEEDKK